MTTSWLDVEGEWVVEASDLGWRVALLQGAGWTDPIVIPCCGRELPTTAFTKHQQGWELTHWDYHCEPCNRRLVIFND